ncbi:MAG: hypothetical protein CMC57_01740 [Flavobacteriaceae bacterium]|nr:hypothetical protein [Flavobacteriaceae bacterium]|tara:strand:+ start:475 stop:1965 length:1491 start_codon:yes stop_codon:yes gene_type:complete
MGLNLKEKLGRIFAYLIYLKNKKWIKNPIKYQIKTFNYLIKKGSNTIFGSDHFFSKIKTYDDFKKNIPIKDYEDIRPYIDKILLGEINVLWPGKPIYLAKTSGTTSGLKYIPITKESMKTHIISARDSLLNYIYETGNSSFINGKHIFLQGSPVLEEKQGIHIGRLSGIAAHYVPNYLQKNRMPSWETNCIEDWEKKVDKIIEETLNEKMTLISGIPSWVQMYFEKIISKKKKRISEIFQDFSLFVHGGVNYDPYKSLFEKLIGKKIDSVEVFPASEGFFAYQDKQKETGLLLLVNNDIFYEFIKVKDFGVNNNRIPLSQVKKGVEYVMIISTSAGLWAYNLGDTIKFVSLYPFRIIVTGRIKHFISAFGEHVIGKEVETAIKKASEESFCVIREFTVAPQINPERGLPYHEWFIDFDKPPENILEFSLHLDNEMRSQNLYYDDLISGKILKKLVIRKVIKNGFQKYMKEIGKLGGQNKVPRLSNDRSIVDKLTTK